jgi:hypothetical protein
VPSLWNINRTALISMAIYVSPEPKSDGDIDFGRSFIILFAIKLIAYLDESLYVCTTTIFGIGKTNLLIILFIPFFVLLFPQILYHQRVSSKKSAFFRLQHLDGGRPLRRNTIQVK